MGVLRDTWDPHPTPEVVSRVPEVFTSFDIPPSAYGGGASTNFFPHMCLLLPGPGPLPSPHIFFPFASCLGLGRVGRVGGCGPPGLWSSWLSPSQGDIEKRLGLEPKGGSWGFGA